MDPPFTGAQSLYKFISPAELKSKTASLDGVDTSTSTEGTWPGCSSSKSLPSTESVLLKIFQQVFKTVEMAKLAKCQIQMKIWTFWSFGQKDFWEEWKEKVCAIIATFPGWDIVLAFLKKNQSKCKKISYIYIYVLLSPSLISHDEKLLLHF